MRTKALKVSQLWKLRGTRAVIERLMAQYTSKLYSIRTDNLYEFHKVPAEQKPFENYDLVLREVPENDPLEWDAEIMADPDVDADRFRQGARRYVAIWDGRGIDLCWAVSDCDFHDCLDGFTMRLGKRDVYLFDYRGIQKERPPAFCRFKLWTQMACMIVDSENSRVDGGAKFLTLVSQENRVSNAFHVRKLGAKLIGKLHTRILLKKPISLLDSNTPDIFI